MISPDLFERAVLVPETLNPAERVVFGVATIQAAMDVPGAVSEEIARLTPENLTQLLGVGIDIAAQGLRELRTNPQFSEADRFSAAAVAVGSLDWKAMEPTVEMAGLLGETMLTIGAGLRTRIQERVGELREGVVDGFYRMTAICMLGDRMEDLTAVGQIRQILNSDLHTPEDRKEIALRWAKHLAREVDGEQCGKMLRFYGRENNDMEAVLAISEVILRTLDLSINIPS